MLSPGPRTDNMGPTISDQSLNRRSLLQVRDHIGKTGIVYLCLWGVGGGGGGGGGPPPRSYCYHSVALSCEEGRRALV